MRPTTFVLFFGMLASSSALAKPIGVGVEELSAERTNRGVLIEYALEKKSWRRLRRAGIKPKLILQVENADRGVPAKDRLKRKLNGRTGEVRFELPRRFGKLKARLHLKGEGDGDRIGWMVFGDVEAKAIELRLRNSSSSDEDAAPPQVNWAGNPKVIDLCERAFDGDKNERACTAAVKNARFNPLRMIDQCEKSMDGDQKELECIRLAVRASYEPTRAIAACDKSFDGDTNELRCVQVIAKARKDPTGTLEACDRSQSGDQAELKCLEQGI